MLEHSQSNRTRGPLERRTSALLRIRSTTVPEILITIVWPPPAVVLKARVVLFVDNNSVYYISRVRVYVYRVQ